MAHTMIAGCNLSGLPVDLFRDVPCAECEAESRAAADAARAAYDRRDRIAAAIEAALTPAELASVRAGTLNLSSILLAAGEMVESR